MTLAEVVQAHGARLRAALVRLTRDFDLAEDALQEAFAEAATTWPAAPPHEPVGWLLTTARRRAIDAMRRRDREAMARRALLLVPEDLAPSPEEGFDERRLDDDVLRLVFVCAHPALPLEGRVALTLRVVGGLSTQEIARAFFVSEPTMAQRLVRMKSKVAEAGIPFRVPDDAELAERVDGILAVVYLIFTEGYAATEGAALLRVDLCEEALRLARLLVALLPNRAECRGLLALLLLTHARRAARATPEGDVVLLEHQDRSLWDRAAVGEGLSLLDGLAAERVVEPYTLQAAIAGVHAAASSGEATDWRAIVALYDRLLALTPSPFVALNRAAAVAMRDGAAAALPLLEPLRAELATHPLFHSTEAALRQRGGDGPGAVRAYRSALALSTNGAERRFLEARISELAPTE